MVLRAVIYLGSSVVTLTRSHLCVWVILTLTHTSVGNPTPYKITCMWNLKKKLIQMNLFAKEKPIHRPREQTFVYQRGKGRIKRKEKTKKEGASYSMWAVEPWGESGLKMCGKLLPWALGDSEGTRPIPFLCMWPGSIFTRSRSAWNISKGPSASGLHQLTQLRSSLLKSVGVQFSVTRSQKKAPNLCNN